MTDEHEALWRLSQVIKTLWPEITPEHQALLRPVIAADCELSSSGGSATPPMPEAAVPSPEAGVTLTSHQRSDVAALLIAAIDIVTNAEANITNGFKVRDEDLERLDLAARSMRLWDSNSAAAEGRAGASALIREPDSGSPSELQHPPETDVPRSASDAIDNGIATQVSREGIPVSKSFDTEPEYADLASPTGPEGDPVRPLPVDPNANRKLPTFVVDAPASRKAEWSDPRCRTRLSTRCTLITGHEGTHLFPHQVSGDESGTDAVAGTVPLAEPESPTNLCRNERCVMSEESCLSQQRNHDGVRCCYSCTHPAGHEPSPDPIITLGGGRDRKIAIGVETVEGDEADARTALKEDYAEIGRRVRGEPGHDVPKDACLLCGDVEPHGHRWDGDKDMRYSNHNYGGPADCCCGGGLAFVEGFEHTPSRCGPPGVSAGAGGYAHPLAVILRDIAVERARQDEKWGGPAHDDTHALADWSRWIQDRAQLVRNVDIGHAALTRGATRRQLIEIAALAVAAVESFDRRAGDTETKDAT